MRPPSLRIAEIAPVWLPVPPPGYGGIERVVSVLTEELVGRGHDVTLFAIEGSRTSATLVPTMAAAPHPDDPNGALDDVTHSLAAYLRAGEFDVIHDHSRLGPALAAARAGTFPPVVHTVHNGWTPEIGRLLAAVDERVDVVAISRSQADAMPDIRCAGMVYNGIDVAAHPYRADKGEHLAFVGRINPQKGPAEALRIAHLAGWPLRMAVKRIEQGEWDYWHEVVAPLVGPEDEVLEQPPEAVKLDLMAGAVATLVPITWAEPFGLVMAESMACGTPVIARPLGAAPEVVDHGVTGFLFDTEEEMAAAVADVGSLAPAACRERVERCFSACAMARGYERVFRRAGGALRLPVRQAQRPRRCSSSGSSKTA